MNFGYTNPKFIRNVKIGYLFDLLWFAGRNGRFRPDSSCSCGGSSGHYVEGYRRIDQVLPREEDFRHPHCWSSGSFFVRLCVSRNKQRWKFFIFILCWFLDNVLFVSKFQNIHFLLLQAVQFMLADMAVNLELSRLITYKAAVDADNGIKRWNFQLATQFSENIYL